MRLRQLIGTTASKVKSAPVISICYFNGRIGFNAPTVELLGLKEGDALAFYQDEENPTNWYFQKSKAVGSIALKASGKSLNINNTGISRPILASLGFHESKSFFISSNLIEGKYWAILSEKKL